MNVASRMESTGVHGSIQVSQETADLLVEAGMKVQPREQKIEAKGKGLLQTYWLDTSAMTQGRCMVACTGDELGHNGAPDLDERSASEQEMDRLVDWNTNNLVQLLRVVHARRIALDATNTKLTEEENATIREYRRSLDEFNDVINLPSFVPAAAEYKVDVSALGLHPELIAEVRQYVWTIAQMYHNNHFHNFTHASHMCMSVLKLLSRISSVGATAGNETITAASRHHEDTYGITSDPLTCFSCVFAALIHDVDHTGIPNAVLIKENGHLAKVFKGKSIAEQNSVDVAWNLLMEDRFRNFRQAIFTNKGERKRFRQVIVNSVMATDVLDKQLKELRNRRWDLAFGATGETAESSQSISSGASNENQINRKATVVMETLILASDVRKCMPNGLNIPYRHSLTSASFTLFRLLIPCSIGRCIVNGTKSYIWKCFKRTWMVGLTLIQPTAGSKTKLASWTFTSFHWQRNWLTVECLG
jgi:3'5'-cyclic nucleotide phosphodiesterase/Adenylate and Guanylate cyclase catalytic domain